MTGRSCEKCEFAKVVFGDYIECVRLHCLMDWRYWHNEIPDDCPIEKRKEE